MGFLTPSGMERIGGFKFNAAAVSSGLINIPPRDILLVQGRVTGYSGSDIVSLRFNNDSTVTNYTSSHVNVTTTPGIGRVNNAGTLGHIPLASTAMTVGRIFQVLISNFSTTRKVCKILTSDEQSATTAATIDIAGFGEWLNTTTQINQIEMRTSGGTVNLNIGSGFTVYGGNL